MKQKTCAENTVGNIIIAAMKSLSMPHPPYHHNSDLHIWALTDTRFKPRKPSISWALQGRHRLCQRLVSKTVNLFFRQKGKLLRHSQCCQASGWFFSKQKRLECFHIGDFSFETPVIFLLSDDAAFLQAVMPQNFPLNGVKIIPVNFFYWCVRFCNSSCFL